LTLGEMEMKKFVQEYYESLITSKHHQIDLALKKIRFRHEVLS